MWYFFDQGFSFISFYFTLKMITLLLCGTTDLDVFSSFTSVDVRGLRVTTASIRELWKACYMICV